MRKGIGGSGKDDRTFTVQKRIFTKTFPQPQTLIGALRWVAAAVSIYFRTLNLLITAISQIIEGTFEGQSNFSTTSSSSSSSLSSFHNFFPSLFHFVFDVFKRVIYSSPPSTLSPSLKLPLLLRFMILLCKREKQHLKVSSNSKDSSIIKKQRFPRKVFSTSNVIHSFPEMASIALQ